MTQERDFINKTVGEAYDIGLRAAKEGRVADYIPELAKANPNSFGIHVLYPDGGYLGLGDTSTRFSAQSVAKVIILAAALTYFGFDETFSHVMMEPSGDSFNSIIKLDVRSNLPFNPMINPGAIQTVSLLAGKLSFGQLLRFSRTLCKDNGIVIDEDVYRSEFETGDRNRAIAYLLKSKNVLMSEPEKTIDLYFKMCSLSVTAKSLASLGLIIANNGIDPETGEQLIADEYARTLKSIMFTCGMYDYSGEFGVRVGVPSKSGVGGGLVCAAKGPIGIGFYGPALDPYGNSIAAVRAMEHISKKLGLHIFS